jgi:hypothetical protein
MPRICSGRDFVLALPGVLEAVGDSTLSRLPGHSLDKRFGGGMVDL